MTLAWMKNDLMENRKPRKKILYYFGELRHYFFCICILFFFLRLYRVCAMFLPELGSFVAAMLFAVQPIHTEAVSLYTYLFITYFCISKRLLWESSSHFSTTALQKLCFKRHSINIYECLNVERHGSLLCLTHFLFKYDWMVCGGGGLCHR